jgi:hypothetical protein
MFSTSISKCIATCLISILFITLAGCSLSPKTHVVQLNDEQLTREEIRQELNKLDISQQKIESNKGLTGTNVMAALFFLPGLGVTYFDAYEATRLVEARRSHLINLYNKKYGETRQADKNNSNKNKSA